MRPDPDEVDAACGRGMLWWEGSGVSWGAPLAALLGCDAAPSWESLAACFVDADRPRLRAALRGDGDDPDPLWTVGGRAVLVRAEPGRFAAVHDVSALARRLDAKRAALALTEALAHVGRWTIALDSGSVWWSPEMYRITGRSPDQPPTLGCLDAQVHPDDLPALVAFRAASLAGGPPPAVEVRLRRDDGDRTIVVSGQIFTSGGRAQAVGVAHDVTEARSMARRLADQNQVEALSRLARGIAHDYNNLLQVIRANLEIAGAEQPSELLDDATDATLQAIELTQRLSSLQPNTHERRAPIRLRPWLLAAAPALEAEAGGPIEVTLSGDPVVHVGASGARAVLAALLTNARDAGATRVAVRLADGVGADGAFAELTVEDDGEGMDAATLLRAAEPFFTTRRSRARRGMGLTLARAEVERCGGTLELFATAGAGATARVRWPCAPKPVDAAPAAAGAVLVVEDDAAVRRVVCRMVERMGFAVVEAADPQQAEGRLHPGLRLVLSDVVMPGGGGLRVLELHGLHCPQVPIAFMSGYVGDSPWLEGRPFLPKPFQPTDLAGLMRALNIVEA